MNGHTNKTRVFRLRQDTMLEANTWTMGADVQLIGSRINLIRSGLTGIIGNGGVMYHCFDGWKVGAGDEGFRSRPGERVPVRQY